MDVYFPGGAKVLLSALHGTPGTTVTIEGGGAIATVKLSDALKKLAHKSADYMPAINRILRAGAFATPEECAEHLERLRCRVEACLADEQDPAGGHGGFDLGAYTRPLLDLVDASPGDTWEEVFDAVDALIQAAIEEHEVREHVAPPSTSLSKAVGVGDVAPTGAGIAASDVQKAVDSARVAVVELRAMAASMEGAPAPAAAPAPASNLSTDALLDQVAREAVQTSLERMFT